MAVQTEVMQAEGEATQITCKFSTKLPPQYKVPSTEIVSLPLHAPLPPCLLPTCPSFCTPPNRFPLGLPYRLPPIYPCMIDWNQQE